MCSMSPLRARVLRALCTRNVAVSRRLTPQAQGVLSPVFSSAAFSSTSPAPTQQEHSSVSDKTAEWTPTSEVNAKSSSATSQQSSAHWTSTCDVGVETDLQNSFVDSESSFAHLSMTELARANVVLQACAVAGPLVPYIDKLYGGAVSVIGTNVIHEAMRPTAFAHFCGGEKALDMLPKLKSLQQYGVGGILDYAAEAKEGGAGGPSNESKYDSQIALFEEAIGVASQGGSDHNLVAIKVSALCDVPLLIKASKGLVEAQRVFFRLAEAEFETGQEDAFGVPFVASPASVLDAASFARGWPDSKLDFGAVDIRGAGCVDLVDWTAYWTPARIAASLADCALAHSFPVLSEEELACLERAETRIDAVCANARQLGVRLLVDAEWSKAQPAMDHLALCAMKKHNVLDAHHRKATVLQTYQCYLRGSLGRCQRDHLRSRREGWSFGAKLVRGAYIVQERGEAAEAGRVSPIWDSLPLTEENYHAAIGFCLSNLVQGDQITVASHNTGSLLFAIRKMRELKLDPQEAGVLFGQLLGMAEAASFSLAKHGYRVFKYMPYGPLDEVVPYLLRRTQENSTLLGTPAVKQEREMLLQEMTRRATGLDMGWMIRSS